MSNFNFNWYKLAQVMHTDSFESHPNIANLKRHLSAEDEEGNYIDIIVVPIINSGKEYVTIQLDARHGGARPASAVLAKIYEVLLRTNTGLDSNKFIDDHFGEEEAKLPKGSYKSSSMDLVLGPASSGAIYSAISALCESWKSECMKMVKLNLINSYAVSDAKYKVIYSGESQKLSDDFAISFKKDADQVRIFLCRLGRFARSNANLKKWTDELYQNVTDWTWRGIHANPFPGGQTDDADCSKSLNSEWIDRFSANMDSPTLEMFKHISGEKVPNFEYVIDIIKDMPPDVAEKRGVEVLIGYASKEGNEVYIKGWINNVSKDKLMFSMSVLSHPWAAVALEQKYPELAAKIRSMQKGKT